MIELDAEVFEISGTAAQRLVVLHPAPGTVAETRLGALAEGPGPTR